MRMIFSLILRERAKNKAAFWLKHPLRRTFENIVFDPARPGDYDRNFNIFKGFPRFPEKGDCSLFWNHVKEVICSNHEKATVRSQMDQRGLSSLLFDLLHEDLTAFDPRKMPPNDFGFDIKMKTASSSEKFIFNVLARGEMQSWQEVWGALSCEEFYDNYKAWCLREGFRQEASSEFGKRLRKLLSVEKSRRSVDGTREWWYMLPSLEECRKRFQSFTKQTSGIWEE